VHFDDISNWTGLRCPVSINIRQKICHSQTPNALGPRKIHIDEESRKDASHWLYRSDNTNTFHMQ
jgi:hypothetical protein